MSNFSIIKKIQKGNTKTRLLGAAILIIVAILLPLVAIPKTTKYLLASKNVFGVTSDHYKSNKFYRGKTSYLYDWFAENDEGRFYFAPTYDENGNEEYLIVYIPDDYEDKANRIIDQTIEYLTTADDSVITESINCRGFTDIPNSKTIEYARQYFDLANAPSEKNHICEYMFVMVPVKDVLLSESTFFLLIDICVIIGAVCVIISIFTKGYMKNLKKRMAKEGKTLDDLDAEFSNPIINIGDTYVSNERVMTASANPRMLMIKDVIWIHSNKTNSVNSNQAVFNSVFYTRNHEVVKFPMKDATSADVLCQAVHTLQPRALFGYVIENSNMYYQHFNELVDQVYNQNEETPVETAPESTSEIPAVPSEAPSVVPAAAPSEVPAEAPVSEAPAQPAATDILTPSSVSPKEEEENL